MSGGYWSKGTKDVWFYLLLGASGLAVAWVFWAYLYVLLYAGVTVVCCWPAYKLLLRLTRGRAWTSSGLTTLLLALLVFVPLGIVLWLFALEVQEVSQVLIEMVQSGELSKQLDEFLESFEIPPWIEGFVPELPEILNGSSAQPPPEPPPEGLAEAARWVTREVVGLASEPLFAAPYAEAMHQVTASWAEEQAVRAAEAEPLDGFAELFSRLSVVEEELTAGLQDATLTVLRFAGAELPGIVSTVVSLSIDTLIYVFAVLVLFVEGPRLLTVFQRLLPIEERYSQDLFDVFSEFSRNMVVGSIATSAIQGIIAGLGFAIVGLEKVIFLAILVFFGSFIPVIGTPVVWVPVVIYMLGVGDYGQAIFLTLWCLILVGTIDNVLRPLFMRGNSEMHALLIFLAVFGGMYWMGLAGVLVGPVLVAIFMSLYRIYVRDYLGIAPPQESGEPGWTSRLAGRVLAWAGERLLQMGKERSGEAISGWGELLQTGESARFNELGSRESTGREDAEALTSSSAWSGQDQAEASAEGPSDDEDRDASGRASDEQAKA
ncbi:MAG: AI-2E family transporter [Deltaproteobacteria bacterium]|nr:MAG: AI-2E family transporter [Deltaproteobacteria bacterium]